MRLLRILVTALLIVALGYVGVLSFVLKTIPSHNSADTHFDTLIVLGNPARMVAHPRPNCVSVSMRVCASTAPVSHAPDHDWRCCA